MAPENNHKIVIPKLIVGLGNPERKYEKTRHNIGFEVVEYLAESWLLSWQKNQKFQGLFAEGISTNGNKIKLLKPLTYMNRSGQSVRAVLDWYKLPIESILVAYDDMDLPIGRIRLRLSGSAGGHNGIKSIISHLGGQNFPRFRIGIGKSSAQNEAISHVLGKFSPEEAKVMSQVLKIARESVEVSLKEGVEKAMSLYNGMNIVDSSDF